MDFRIAYTFTDSLSRLTGEEQKSVKMAAFDLQLNPANPGFSFHKLEKAKDKNFWSVRVSSDIRLIVHRTAGSLLLCYVDHHDKAYDWAERRKLETHPKTGAAQFVEIREKVQEIVVPKYVEVSKPVAKQKILFSKLADAELLTYGVPAEWLNDVRQATEDNLLTLVDHLPSEAAEALLELATGGTPRLCGVGHVARAQEPFLQSATSEEPQLCLSVGSHVAEAVTAYSSTTPFEHPDAQRRFRTIANAEELARALEYPWEKWTVFLHPDQKQLVERDYSGPARVTGSAGTGKTIVALHRAVFLARTNVEARVLLATFSDTLAHALHTKLRRLIGNEPRLGERIDVHSLSALGLRLYKALVGHAKLATRKDVRALIKASSDAVAGQKFSLYFLLTEWEHVIDAWQLSTWEAYRDVSRLGRKTRLPEPQRAILWSIFERCRAGLKDRGLSTEAAVFTELATQISKAKKRPFDVAIVDESQDIGVAQLRFFAALGGNCPNALFFAGDLGQRIFQQPFSWKALGVDIRGRSRTLRINYRTSHQIRMQADRLLGPQVADVDGNVDDRRDTISTFNGPPPVVQVHKTGEEESKAVAAWISEQVKAGLAPDEFGIVVRSEAQLPRAQAAVERAGIAFKILDEYVETTSGYASISTMHLAKGLEFRAVAVMACDDDVIPLQERIETVGDDADLQAIYDTERHLLYVACTRARDYLLVTSVDPASEFLDDLRAP